MSCSKSLICDARCLRIKSWNSYKFCTFKMKRYDYDDERSARNESKTNGETINSYFWFTHFSLNWQREFIQHFLLPFRLDILNEFFFSLTHSLAIHAAVYKYFFFRSEWIAFASSFGTNYSLTNYYNMMTESSLTTEVTISSLFFASPSSSVLHKKTTYSNEWTWEHNFILFHFHHRDA